MKEWKPVVGYEGIYEISESGDIRSLDRYIINNGTLVPIKGNKKITRLKANGYVIVDLWKDGKAKTYHVHRLVAEAFIANDENKPTVNHIDGDKVNNHVINLEYATFSEQNIHFYKQGLKSKENIEKAVNAMLIARGKRVV